MFFKVAFFILRLLIALGALAVLAGTLAVFLFENIINFIKGGVGVAVAVVTLFASGFQKSTDAPGPVYPFSPVLLGLAITFSSMFVSVFTPRQKIFLHIVAVLSIAAAAWDIRRAIVTPHTETVYLPVVVLWFVYYVIFLRRA